MRSTPHRLKSDHEALAAQANGLVAAAVQFGLALEAGNAPAATKVYASQATQALRYAHQELASTGGALEHYSGLATQAAEVAEVAAS